MVESTVHGEVNKRYELIIKQLNRPFSATISIYTHPNCADFKICGHICNYKYMRYVATEYMQCQELHYFHYPYGFIRSNLRNIRGSS
jgi:hypothetical protein